MMKYLLAFILGTSLSHSVAQIVESDTTIYAVVDVPAQPVLGMTAWYQEISKTVRYPYGARKSGLEGTVFVAFVINADSTLSDYKILRGPGGDLDAEAIRTLQYVSTVVKWSPGIKGGIPVKQRMVFPFKFKLPQTKGKPK